MFRSPTAKKFLRRESASAGRGAYDRSRMTLNAIDLLRTALIERVGNSRFFIRWPGKTFGARACKRSSGSSRLLIAAVQKSGFLDILPHGSLHDIFRGIAASEAQECFILRQEIRAALFEHGVQSTAQEVTEGVGKIIEGDAGDVEMQLGGPEVGIFAAELQDVSQIFAVASRS